MPISTFDNGGQWSVPSPVVERMGRGQLRFTRRRFRERNGKPESFRPFILLGCKGEGHRKRDTANSRPKSRWR